MLERYLAGVSARQASVDGLVILVKKRFEEQDLVSGLDVRHESAEHTLIGTGRDGDLSGRVESTAEIRRVSIRQRLL